MLSLLTLNIGAAARARADRLLGWLNQRPEELFLLTETSSGDGTDHLLGQFRRAGYRVIKTPDDGDRGAALVSRVDVLDAPPAIDGITIPARVAAAMLDTQPRVYVLAVYVPSRDRSDTKVQRKQQFLASLLRGIETMPIDRQAGLVLGGDYNVIARSHQPAHRGFLPFEFDFLDALGSKLVDAHDHWSPGVQQHSWIGRTGGGYRYDYFHVAEPLATRIAGCAYLHDTRHQRLSDHAAVTMSLQVDATPLDTADPTDNSEPTLF